MRDSQSQEWSDDRVEQMLGNLLRIGVALAAGIVLMGGAIYLVRHGSEPADYGAFRGEPSDLRQPSGIVKEAAEWKGRAIIQLGLLVLIATPVFRVLLSVYAFWRQRDGTYVAITLVVLAVLLFSLFGA